MASRPYLNHRGKELLAIFRNGREDPKILAALRAELVYRSTPSMRDLRIQVDEALARLQAAPASPSPPRPALGRQLQPELPLDAGGSVKPDGMPSRSSKSMVSHHTSTKSRDSDGMDDPTEGARGTVGSIRPCGAINGVPSRWTFPDKRDFEIEGAKNATRVELFVAALRALVKDMRRRGSGMRTVTLEHGDAIPLDGRERGYRFPYDGDAELFEGAKVTIAIGNRTCDGRIVSVSTQWLVVSFEEDLGPTIRTCVLRIDNTAMIEAMADRLDKVRSGEAKLNLTLADDVLDNPEAQVASSGTKHSPKTDRKLNTQQKEFVEHAIANAVTYLWGPPGTGKTRSLSSLNELLFDAGKRVLICSNTNQAVDQVLINLCRTLTIAHPALDDGRVIRIGKTEGIPSEFTEFVTLDGIVRRKSVDLQRRKSLLESEIQRLRLSAAAAHRILDAFKGLDDLERDRDNSAHERAAREKALADAEAVLRQIANSVSNLERELSDRLGAGAVRRLLGHRLIMAQPDLSGSQLEHGEEICGVFFVARGEPPEVLDAVEEALDAVAPAIEHPTEARLPAAMRHRRDIGHGASGFDLPAQPIGIVGLVGQDDGVLAQVAKKLRSDRAIAGLARCQHQFDRQPARVGQRVDFGRQPAARAAHTAIRVTFFELAAC
jgi:hypothetical protein